MLNRKVIQVKKKWSGLVTDYKQYAFILLAVSTFLYIGTIIPSQHIEASPKMLMMGIDCIFLLAAFFCVRRAIFFQKKLQELDED
ncbi:hypothetical protein TW93_02890 [Bacillus pumilus]|nr:YrhC family protein [Bacillus pumilus]KMY22297.1 hypothetical protein TW93_02890 [Bacillus pumilus]